MISRGQAKESGNLHKPDSNGFFIEIADDGSGGILELVSCLYVVESSRSLLTDCLGDGIVNVDRVCLTFNKHAYDNLIMICFCDDPATVNITGDSGDLCLPLFGGATR